MKELLAGIVILLVIGIGGFLYRNEVVRPMQPAPAAPAGSGSNSAQACTQEAKVCPDGTAVGRTGPNCSFAVCPPPNVELTSGSTTIAFVLPSGYAKSANGSSAHLIASYSQSGDQPSLINIYDYPIPAGQKASDVLLANTTFDPSGMQATSTSSFKQVTEGSNVFSTIQIGRFEGQVQTAYYLVRANDVLRFDIIERGVTNWTDPALNVSTLPQHRALLQMLASLQVS
jgi:hypothetical protein